jgi:CDP-paratose 2-epimerase
MKKQVLITGGAGFIGSNYASRLISRGDSVAIFDNLSRAGSRLNLEWLRKTHGDHAFQLINGDVRDYPSIKEATRTADIIVHLAAQVAVTTSVHRPRVDFEINALGTFNVLESARSSGRNPSIVYASTNKVYGGMDDIRIVEKSDRYEYADFHEGISEDRLIDFHSPYGCSKGCGDQYVHDYHRIYGLPTTVFRQSCIYGTRQFGVEDQGWVAWFVIAAVMQKPITIYGDGKQVRDLLFIDDLLEAYDAAIAHPEIAAGQIYNIGGGSRNAISVWLEFFPILEKLINRKLSPAWGNWRPGDQKVYVSDIRKIARELDWNPHIGVEQGIQTLVKWVDTNRTLFEK